MRAWCVADVEQEDGGSFEVEVEVEGSSSLDSERSSDIEFESWVESWRERVGIVV